MKPSITAQSYSHPLSQEAIEEFGETEAPPIRLSAEAMEKRLARRPRRNSLCGQTTQPRTELLNLPTLQLVLEGIENQETLEPFSVAQMGLGYTLILVDCVLDLYNPNAIRSSQGLLLPAYYLSRAPGFSGLAANEPLSNRWR